MDFDRYTLGAIPSPHDPRDYPLTRVVPKLMAFPSEFKLPAPPDAPYDQDGVGACVAFSLALIKAVQEFKEREAWSQYSCGYIYGRREPTDYQGEGMEPRQALSGLLKRGVPWHGSFPDLAAYPVLAAKLKDRPDLDVAAQAQKIGAYVAASDPDEIKSALMQLGPVLFCVPVYDSFYRGGDLPMPHTGFEKLRGYHAVTCMGWKRGDRWVCLNSWGDWGPQHGWFTIPFSYPVMEAWSITDAKPSDPRIVLKIGSREWRVGEVVRQMDVAPFVQGDRTFVPMRFLAEALGCGVDWRPETEEVIITPPVR